MSDSSVKVFDTGGKNVDTESLTVGATTVQRQRMQLAGATATAIAAVQGTEVASTSIGLVTRNVPGSTVQNVELVARNVDAFGRIIVAQPETLFDAKMDHDNLPLLFDDQQTSGAGTTSTYNANQASVTLAVGNSTAGTRVRQSFQRLVYQAGKGQGSALTGVLGTPASGITRRIGLFDGENGLFFESSPTAINVVRRSFVTGSAVDVAVPQSSWNIDKMDGTGSSGITLDFSKTQIFLIQYQWLGVGALWFGFDVGGFAYWAHKISIANIQSVVSMSTPNLPVRYEISNSGAGGAASLLQICSSVWSSGGAEFVGSTRAIYRNAVLTTLNNANWYPALAVRLRATRLGSRIGIENISLACQSTSDYTWRLVLNPTVVGTALSFSELTGSSIEAAVGATNATTVTGGIDLHAGVSDAGAGSMTRAGLGIIGLGSTIAGVADTLVFAVRRDTGTTESFMATMCLLEQA